MARTLPDGWEALEAAGAAPFEITTLRRLAAELPDDHAVFHGIHWTRLDHGYSVFGEVDFIVVGPQGQAVLIEQENGALEETPDGLVKHYTGKTKGVARQIHRSLASLQSRFQQGHAGQHLALDYLLYCPDYRVRTPATAGIPPERIIDAGQADRLATIIATMLAAQPPGVTNSVVHAFLADELELALDPGALVGQARTWVTRLSGGLATGARRLEFVPLSRQLLRRVGVTRRQPAPRPANPGRRPRLQASTTPNACFCTG